MPITHNHADVIAAIRSSSLWILTTILPEVDYIVTKYLGEYISRAFLLDLVQGAFSVLTLELTDLERTHQLMEQYSDIPIGFIDARFCRS
jgi:hypothetical protein